MKIFKYAKDQTISKNNLGLRSSMSGLGISIAPTGVSTTLLVEILFPCLLASVFFLSFSLTLATKAVLQADFLRC